MAASVCLAMCFANLNKGKVCQVVLAFIIVTALCTWYLCLNEFTTWTTAILASSGVGCFIAIGFATSVHFRCSSCIFFITMTSRFGLVMLHLSSSWMGILDAISNILATLRTWKGLAACNSSLGVDQLDFETDFGYFDDIVSFLHYGSFIPFFGIFVYSFLYEYTYLERQIYKCSNPDYYVQDRVNTFFLVLKYSVAMCVVGSVTAVTLCLYVVQWLLYYSLNDFKKEEMLKCLTHDIISVDVVRLYFYIAISSILAVLSFGSRYINKTRGYVIRNFFEKVDGQLVAIERNVCVTKPYNDRVSYKELKQRLKERRQRKRAAMNNVSKFEHQTNKGIQSKAMSKAPNLNSSPSYDSQKKFTTRENLQIPVTNVAINIPSGQATNEVFYPVTKIVDINTRSSSNHISTDDEFSSE